MSLLLTLIAATTPLSPETPLDCAQVDRAVTLSQQERVPAPRTATDVQLVAHHSLCGGWDIIDVWRSWNATPRLWYARRKTMNSRGHLTVTLLDEESCPAIVPVLTALNEITLRVSVITPPWRPGVTPPPPPPMADGTQYTLRVLIAGQSDYSRASITVSVDDGAIANWADTGLRQLASCWRP
ncbi:hypothetical protein FHT00_000538 [Sphingomonas insulae]|nr:hypothetical protein [Sphingomonas insulae]NIJ28610.1 hypothetical protein [Sphingomonas insulae]